MAAISKLRKVLEMVKEEMQVSHFLCAVQISDSKEVATEYGYAASAFLIVPRVLPLSGVIVGVIDRQLHSRHPLSGQQKVTYTSDLAVFTDESLPSAEREKINALIQWSSDTPSAGITRTVRKALLKGLYAGPVGLRLHAG